MINLHRTLLCCLAALVSVGWTAPGWAQEEDAEPHAASVSPDEGEDPQAADHAHDEVDHHIANDPTHANVSDQTFEVVDFRTDMAFFTAVVFLLLLAGLAATAWKPIMHGLERREHRIADNIARAEKASAEATAKLEEYEAKLAAANQQAQEILAEARKDAEATGQKMIAAAQEEAARQRDRAVADIEAAKRLALTDLANQSTDIAMSLAQRIVGREVRPEDHHNLIQDMLGNLPSKN